MTARTDTRSRPAVEPAALLERYRAAKAKRGPWEAHWQDCYDYALPNGRSFLHSGSPGERRVDRLFDGTAPDAVEQLASSLLAQLTPPWSRWFGFAPGPELAGSERARIGDELDRAAGRALLGGTVITQRSEEHNHSDSTLVMRLPKERIVFIVDTIPVGSVPGRGMIDFHPLETEAFMKKVLKMDWDRLIPGHPGPNDRLGTKDDVRAQLKFLEDASAAMKILAQDGKCWDTAERDFKLPQYESWPGYATNLPFVARRYCGLWGRGT